MEELISIIGIWILVATIIMICIKVKNKKLIKKLNCEITEEKAQIKKGKIPIIMGIICILLFVCTMLFFLIGVFLLASCFFTLGFITVDSDFKRVYDLYYEVEPVLGNVLSFGVCISLLVRTIYIDTQINKLLTRKEKLHN